MKEAYEELHIQGPAVGRYTSGWRLISFQNVFGKEYRGKAWRDFGSFEKYHPLKNEAARRALRKFLK